MIKFFYSCLFVVFMISCSNNHVDPLYLEYQVDSISSLLDDIQNSYRYSYSMQLDWINSEVEVIDAKLDTCKMGEIATKSDRLYFHYCASLSYYYTIIFFVN